MCAPHHRPLDKNNFLLAEATSVNNTLRRYLRLRHTQEDSISCSDATRERDKNGRQRLVQPVQPISVHKVVLVKKGVWRLCMGLEAFLETLIGRLDRLDRLDRHAERCLT